MERLRNSQLEFSTWGITDVYSSSIQNMFDGDDAIYDQVLKQRQKWISEGGFWRGIVRKGFSEFAINELQIPVIFHLPKARHDPAKNDPEFDNIITISDLTGSCEVILKNNPDVRNHHWESKIVVSKNLQYSDHLYNLIQVEALPSVPRLPRVLSPNAPFFY